MSSPQSSDKQTNFIAEFTRIYNQINTVLEQLEPGTVIHPGSGWRVHDLLGHLAVWYQQRINVLKAYQRGEDYQIPGFEMDKFNHSAADERKDRPFADIHTEWQHAHRNLIAQLKAIPADRYDDEVMYPWGARGPIGLLLERLIEHGDEHYAEFVGAAAKT